MEQRRLPRKPLPRRLPKRRQQRRSSSIDVVRRVNFLDADRWRAETLRVLRPVFLRSSAVPITSPSLYTWRNFLTPLVLIAYTISISAEFPTVFPPSGSPQFFGIDNRVHEVDASRRSASRSRIGSIQRQVALDLTGGLTGPVRTEGLVVMLDSSQSSGPFESKSCADMAQRPDPRRHPRAILHLPACERPTG